MMLVEMRTYTCYPGKMGEYLAKYEAEGLAIQKPILGRMVGYYSTEIGPLNQVVHMWGYADLAERTERRAKMMANPEWLAYVAKVQPLLKEQESKILNPAKFFKVQYQD